jgi:hypothetical protein
VQRFAQRGAEGVLIGLRLIFDPFLEQIIATTRIQKAQAAIFFIAIGISNFKK